MGVMQTRAPSQGLGVKKEGPETAAPSLFTCPLREQLLLLSSPPILFWSFIAEQAAGRAKDTWGLLCREQGPCRWWRGGKRGRDTGMAGAGGRVVWPHPPVTPLG